MYTPRPTADSTAEPLHPAGDAAPLPAAATSVSLNRRQQLALLEHSAQQELLELRAHRDQAQNPDHAEAADWLTTSIDWDLAVP